MNNIFTTLCLIVVLYSSCKHFEIEEYSGGTSINFANFPTTEGNIAAHYTVRFNDKDYLEELAEKEDSIEVLLMGSSMSEEFQFGLKASPVAPDSALMQVCFQNNGVYTFPAGARSCFVKYQVQCPEVGREHFMILSFDTDPAKYTIQPGRTEGMSIRLSVQYTLRPKVWDSRFLGEYSDGKYKWIMEMQGKILENITQDMNFGIKLATDYQKYLTGGGTVILDDNKEPIHWPYKPEPEPEQPEKTEKQ